MNWEKLKPDHYHTEPVEHFYTSTIFDQEEYDKLYDNQNNLSHYAWQKFDEKYKTGFEFKESFSEINFSMDVICLWLFKERSNNTKAYVQISDKQLAYAPNTFLITKSKEISFVETKRKYIRNPLVQIDMKESTWKELLQRFNKIS
jgi:hypothetical protein